MMKENPGLLQRTKIRGKSGASYYGYRLNTSPTIELIKDPSLLSFYKKVKS